ncbi:MAG: TetR/AcrR family transcriptional regulator [Steroidobacteraceae bacterium]
MVRKAPKRASRKPGRPVETDISQRERLLEAACSHLATAGAESLTLRGVALRAGVSPSLANYYFVDRGGLIDAVRNERLLPLSRALCRSMQERRGDPGGGIAAFIQNFHGVAARNPWFAPMLFLHTPRLREDEPGRPVDALAPIVELLGQLVTAAQQVGAVRHDLRVENAVLSLLSLCAFAYVARDTLATQLGIDRGLGGAPALTLHQMAILRSGLQSPRQEARP